MEEQDSACEVESGRTREATAVTGVREGCGQ